MNSNINVDDLSNSTIVSIILIKDEIRKEAVEGVKMVSNAHIKTIMITGDNKDTAVSIGREVGIYKDGDYDTSDFYYVDVNSTDHIVTRVRHSLGKRCTLHYPQVPPVYLDRFHFIYEFSDFFRFL